MLLRRHGSTPPCLQSESKKMIIVIMGTGAYRQAARGRRARSDRIHMVRRPEASGIPAERPDESGHCQPPRPGLSGRATESSLTTRQLDQMLGLL